MPNWCVNRLVVQGDRKTVDQFIFLARGKRAEYSDDKIDPNYLDEADPVPSLVFNALVPVPQDILDKGYSAEGYEWQIENWGTKWDVNGVFIKRSGNKVIYDFETAWTPPLEWLHAVSQSFPQLRFSLKYMEPGKGLNGTLVMEGGSEVAHPN